MRAARPWRSRVERLGVSPWVRAWRAGPGRGRSPRLAPARPTRPPLRVQVPSRFFAGCPSSLLLRLLGFLRHHGAGALKFLDEFLAAVAQGFLELAQAGNFFAGAGVLGLIDGAGHVGGLLLHGPEQAEF